MNADGRRDDRVIAVIFAAGVAALLLFLLNAWLLFGVVVCGVLVLGLALGYGAGRRRLAISLSLILLFVAYGVLLVGMVRALGSGDSSRLVLGFPAATALLVYGIWPLPLLAGLLYALMFRSSVLPEERLEKFLAEHGRQRPAR